MVCYNRSMELLMKIIAFLCHLFFIGLSYQLLISVIDWTKMSHYRPENLGKLRLFVFLLAIALGYLVSHFMLEIIQISQSLFFEFR
ncbi:UNVERIFIED_CONTAM: DUF1146 family protein [Streptococcus canis]|uniref:DUF1146 family protein n=2 Tax=Streptococcus canis TaxID=1329 RepID=A0AAE4Q863_STRCB|nr:DUF1146 family protein [Streptococcus canis]